MTEYLIWDWNGTLLDDVDFNRLATNKILRREGFAEMESVEYYRSIFGFPTEEYYKRAGFDFSKTPYSQLAEDYSEIYWADAHKCSLAEGTIETLDLISKANIPQMILSLSRQDRLDTIIDQFDLRNRFTYIAGSGDYYAVSKADIARSWAEKLRQEGINMKNALFVGDTSHDYSVSLAMGCRCLLYSGGHEDKKRLLETGCTVIDHIKDVIKYL